jgi:hypothetical protein
VRAWAFTIVGARAMAMRSVNSQAAFTRHSAAATCLGRPRPVVHTSQGVAGALPHGLCQSQRSKAPPSAKVAPGWAPAFLRRAGGPGGRSAAAALLDVDERAPAAYTPRTWHEDTGLRAAGQRKQMCRSPGLHGVAGGLDRRSALTDGPGSAECWTRAPRGDSEHVGGRQPSSARPSRTRTAAARLWRAGRSRSSRATASRCAGHAVIQVR